MKTIRHILLGAVAGAAFATFAGYPLRAVPPQTTPFILGAYPHVARGDTIPATGQLYVTQSGFLAEAQ